MIAELARRYWDAEESRDLDAILGFFTPDAVWSGPSGTVHGREAIREFYAASAARFPGLEVRMGAVLGDDREAAISWEASFRDHAGRTFPLTGVNLFRVEDGRFSSLTTFNDPSTLEDAPAVPQRFGGRTAIVTGAASGIGEATARRLVHEGAVVLGVDRNAERLAAVADELGDRFRPCVVDLGLPDAPERVMAAFSERHDVLDLLVNNAAAFVMAGVAAERAEWVTTVDTNLITPARLVGLAVPALRRSTAPAVVNVASVSGHVAQADRWTYNSVKGAVLSLTRCQALDLSADGIRVNSVSPGYIWTDVLERSAGGDRDTWDPRWGQYCMLGRCGEPDEAAGAIVYLLGPDATYVTGTDLLVDGGLVTMSPDGKARFDFD
ncbi:SDR family oxidoreductase [Agromyces silvae]|uniref:SDR family oxidoreductase n=1 Tax=Agromyces silvae TaxID=3388266 RepID=UPI00280A72D7|nr:SDR family oxidoreductase [Agromyces protaetiae]